MWGFPDLGMEGTWKDKREWVARSVIKLCHRRGSVRLSPNNRYIQNGKGVSWRPVVEVSQWSVSGLKRSHWKTFTAQLNIFPEDNSEMIRHQLFVLLPLSPCPCKYHAPSQRRFYLVCIQLLLLFPTSFTVLHTYLLYS